MRILFFIESLHSGGKERRLVELIKGLGKYSDIKTEIVVTKDDVNYKEIFELDIKVHFLTRKKAKDPKVFFDFYRIAKSFRPDLIHVWGRMVAIYAIPAKILLNVPLINSEITDAAPDILPPELSLKISFFFSNKLLSNSFAGLKAYNAPAEKSSVIYNGFDFNRIRGIEGKELVRQKFNIKTNYVVGMVASFSKNKDYNTFLKAAQFVLSVNDDISFLCVGNGDMSEYEKSIEKRFIENIHFLGLQSNVESIMNICDIGVLTSNSNVHGEGISNSLMEFMALGKPVIANDCGGNIELIKDGINGFIIDGGKDLSEKIQLLINDENLRNKQGNNSKSIVQNKFHIDKMVNGFKKIYSEYE